MEAQPVVERVPTSAEISSRHVLMSQATLSAS
ncbi:MAG: hypothetical protein QOG87_205 [Actinomycetota bacterium]|jgi:hypothetical protein